MIKKLKRRFIVLAMVSLTVLLSVIVAGMNMINYNKVVSDADTRLEVLEKNSARIMLKDMLNPFGNFDEYYFDDDDNRFLFGHRGPGGPSMTRDEAEESRFFIVSVDESGSVLKTYTDRIYSVDTDEAAKYAEKALASGDESGFVGDFRFAVSDSVSSSTITFLDCGRTLGSFYSFLRASILMSLLGLLAVFFVILYFAGRIVRPVAESYEKQKRFITDAGHEIKTPLAIIKANIDLMDMEIDSGVEGRQEGLSISSEAADNLKENLGDINDQIDRLAGLTNDLVYLSRMEEAESSLVMTDVPLSDIVSETAESFESLALEKGKIIECDIAPAVTVKGSTKELEKLLSIVLENAVKYSVAPRRIPCSEDEDGMPVPPVINVALRKEGRNAVIEVRNETENELTNEQLSHVFERFYRMDSSRNSQTGGHGIGLSMASAIVSAHGGHISAHTASGHDFIVTAAIPMQ
ncbi:MAG: HAMP domain-containing histidine kinase [Mogibacterium sp.]|nr:HAMP domain-containing histidine kinase [Mogibacterium sp.]